MTKHAPRSTLFPYTTLFRSAEAALAPFTLNRLNGTPALDLNNNLNAGPDPSADATWAYQWDFTIGGDRKSTRLNSSHVEISYAVFCLKKKRSTSRAMPQRRT